MKTPSGSDHCPRAPNRSGCYEPFRFDTDFAPHFKIQSAAVGRRRPSVRRDTAADSASGAAGVAGYAVFPLHSPRPGPYETFYAQCECSPSPESNGDITLMALLLPMT